MTAELQPITEAAKRLNVAVPRVYAMIREGIFPDGVVVRLGRNLRINPEQLETFIAGGGKALPGGWRREAR